MDTARRFRCRAPRRPRGRAKLRRLITRTRSDPPASGPAGPADASHGADVLIVGAGAAGLATAIFTRRLDPTLSVTLVDGAKRPGAKILVSGGSRCNVTNVAVSEADFWGGRRATIRRILRAFPSGAAVAFFRDLGVAMHVENDGKVFPDSNRSRDVLDALLREVKACGAVLLADHRVVGVRRADSGFVVTTTRGDMHARHAVLATGGLSLPKSGSDGGGLRIAERLGHTLVPTTPALAPLLLAGDEPLHRALAGVAHDAELTMWLDGRASVRRRGALLWTHVGVSGPSALDISRHWLRAILEQRAPALTMSLMPGETLDSIDRRLTALIRDRPRAALHTIVSTLVPASLAGAMLAALAIDAAKVVSHLARDDRRRVARALVEWPLPVSGSRGYAVAEATAGGVSLAEIDPATMQSRVCPGLFLVGEMLDVDGRLGGFNFQWAWSTAFVASRGLARSRS